MTILRFDSLLKWITEPWIHSTDYCSCVIMERYIWTSAKRRDANGKAWDWSKREALHHLPLGSAGGVTCSSWLSCTTRLEECNQPGKMSSAFVAGSFYWGSISYWLHGWLSICRRSWRFRLIPLVSSSSVMTNRADPKSPIINHIDRSSSG